MTGFTLENTKKSEFIKFFGINGIEFYKDVEPRKYLRMSELTDYKWAKTHSKVSSLTKLFRPYNETRNHWTNDNGVTTYAQYPKSQWTTDDHQENIGPHKDQAHHIALQIEALGDIGSPVEFVEDIEPIDIKPIFTQVMADAGDQAAIGSEVLYNVCNPPKVSVIACDHHLKVMEVVAIKGGLFILYCKDSAFTTACNDQWIKPIQTDEDKLRDAINELWDAAPDKWAIIEDVLNNDLFTITLKG